MKILFVVPYVPSLVRVRPYNLIRALTQRGHQVTVLTLWTNAAEQADVEHLRSLCSRVVALPMPRWKSLLNALAAVPRSVPLQAVYSWNSALVEPLLGHLGEYDVVHVEHLRGAQYGLYLQARQMPVVWDSVDCISLLFRQAAARSKRLVSRWMTRFELGRTERYEGWLQRQFQHILVTAPADRDALKALLPSGAKPPMITALPNGVDLDYFQIHPTQAREPATLVVSGKMSYHANVTMTLELVEKIMPSVWAQCPDARLCIVGKDPTPAIRALAQHPAITVTGTVSDVRPYLQRATVAVAPIAYGVGIQNKVLEAMACGTPVVCSAQAVSALTAQPGRDVYVAESATAFAEQVVRLLRHPDERQAVGAAGRHYVETQHDWNRLAAQLETTYAAAQQASSGPH